VIKMLKTAKSRADSELLSTFQNDPRGHAERPPRQSRQTSIATRTVATNVPPPRFMNLGSLATANLRQLLALERHHGQLV
jgi:hypothetical protein